MIQIKVTPEFGRGIYAINPIPAFRVIETCEVLALDSDDTRVVNGLTALEHYTFKLDETRDCLVLGNGELFNHSDRANVLYALAWEDGRQVMVFVTTREIQAGEQLFIDYRADMNVDVDKYIDSSSLMGE